MIGADIYNRIRANKNIHPADKPLIYKLFDMSNQIKFGKIDSRREGYLLEGVGHPRVTNVLQQDGSKSAALMEWAKREVVKKIEYEIDYRLMMCKPLMPADVSDICYMGLREPDRQRDNAAIEGTKTHDNVENWLNGKSYYEDALLDIFRKIWASEGVELIATEIPLVWHSMGLGFGGKLDILAYKDRKFIIYDNKTSRSVHESYGLQVAGAYKKAVEQMSPGLKISKCKIVHLANLDNMSDWQRKQYAKIGNLIDIRNHAKAWKHFKLLLELYEMRNNKYF